MAFAFAMDRSWAYGRIYGIIRSDVRSECVTVPVQTDLQWVTSALSTVGSIIIILLWLGLWLVLGFMVRVGLRFWVMVSVFDRVTR